MLLRQAEQLDRLRHALGDELQGVRVMGVGGEVEAAALLLGEAVEAQRGLLVLAPARGEFGGVELDSRIAQEYRAAGVNLIQV